LFGAFNPYLSPKFKDVAEMDAPGMIAAILGEQLPNISLESIRNMVLTSGLLSLIGSIYFKKLQRFRLTYVLYAASMSLLAIYFIITTLLEGIYITLLLLGLATFSAGFIQIFALSPPPATQKGLILGIVLLTIAGLILIFSYAFLLEQIR
jgi:phosphotransferase system  glucose/maltose/N-acetylglucosamine-specific IIC component